MSDVGVCEQHRAIAHTTDDGGFPLCYDCFNDAAEFAEAVEQELTEVLEEVRKEHEQRVSALFRRLRRRY